MSTKSLLLNINAEWVASAKLVKDAEGAFYYNLLKVPTLDVLFRV